MKPNALPAMVATAAPPAATAVRVAGRVAGGVLADFRSDARLWAWSRLVQGGRALRGVPGLGFAKVLGSGCGGGFGLRPSATHQGLFLVFDEEAAARSFIDRSPLLGGYAGHARELCVMMLRASSSKGSWSGAAVEPSIEAPRSGPIAALTRASIRPAHALAFWRQSPAAERSLAASPGCLLAAGLGEAPLLRQATFSLWSGTAAMDGYARSGAHQQAIRAAYAAGYFSESMFVRFAPLVMRGTWQGVRHG